jgi:predicted RNase H-like nuclease
MPWVAGVDGCRAGWIAVLVEWQQTPVATACAVQLCRQFADILALQCAPAVIGIDIPIGLLETPQPGGRPCDQQARKLLRRRASSVFSPPSRAVLAATHYAQVRGYGMSRQAFGILPKIREVDRLMTPVLQQRVYEAHPELAFLTLTGQPMRHNKKTHAGHEERVMALTGTPDAPFQGHRQNILQSIKAFKRAQVALDDLLDAYALAWTAWRIAQTRACRVPPRPEHDSRGLRMEIWY